MTKAIKMFRELGYDYADGAIDDKDFFITTGREIVINRKLKRVDFVSRSKRSEYTTFEVSAALLKAIQERLKELRGE